MFELEREDYSINQLRYDLRKLKAHDIVQRIDKTYDYQLTDFGKRVCLLCILFHQRIWGPIANSQVNYKPVESSSANTKLEKAYFGVDKAIDRLLKLLAA